QEIKEASIKAGALGCSISGSGPSIFAFSTSRKIAQNVGIAMQKNFESLKIDSRIFISKINQNGPKIIEN
ncbi:MAG: homoserine kinase, partial [Candidatus Sifarchaeia archaeon]